MAKRKILYGAFILILLLTSCKKNRNELSKPNTPGNKENAYEYNTFFLPEKDGDSQPYVGDTMPFYENGSYYIYYLKDGGDSYNHSVYLITTTDFISYQEYEKPVLESSRDASQDFWIGTGSVVKVNDKYLFFYTGHNSSPAMEYKEEILLAEGSSPYNFEKKTGWEIIPPSDLGQKNDFRDPQAYYDAESDKIIMTVTASKGNVARILKYSMNKDLSDIKYEGIIFSDPTKKFWNLECSDTFKIGNYYYITYSAQDDTLWYAISDKAYGPYRNAKRLDSKLFYAAKHVEATSNYYMVGWARRSESPSSTQEVSAWAGNLTVQKIVQKEGGQLLLAPVEAITKQFKTKEKLTGKKNMQIEAGSLYTYEDLALCPESFCLEGKFEYSGKGSFGLAFDYNGRQNKYKTISISPADNKLQLFFNEGNTLIAETEVELTEGNKYSFSYIQDGSVGIFYINNQASLTVRLYGVTGNPVRLFAEANKVKFTDLRQYTK